MLPYVRHIADSSTLESSGPDGGLTGIAASHLGLANPVVVTSEDGFAREALQLPSDGIDVGDLTAFFGALSDADQLRQAIDPASYGVADAGHVGPDHADATSATDMLDDLALLRLERLTYPPELPTDGLVAGPGQAAAAVDGGHGYILGLGWPGARWTIIPDLLDLEHPTMTVLIGPAGDVRVTLDGMFDFSGGIDIDVAVTLRRPPGGSPAQLHVVAGLAASGEHRLGRLLATLGVDLPGIGDITIGDLSVGYDSTTRSLQFEVVLDDVWSPGWGDGSFALEQVAVSLTKAADASLTGFLGARAKIADVDADVHMTLEDDGWTLAVDVEMPAQATLGTALGALGSHLGLPAVLLDAPGFDHLSVRHARAEMSLTDHRVSVSVEVSDPWSPDWCPGIKVTDLQIDVSHVGAPTSETTVDAKGTVTLGGEDVTASITHDGRGSGWVFTAANHGDWTLADVVDGLASGIGLGADDLHLDLDAVHITDISLTANTAEKTMALTLDGTVALGSDGDGASSASLDFGFDVSLHAQPGGGMSKEVAGHITIGPLTFDLAFVPGEHPSFVGSYHNAAGHPTTVGEMIAALTGTSVDVLPFAVRTALVAAVKGDTGYDFLLAVDVDGGLDLTDLPLVSNVLGPDQGVGIAFQAQYATREFTKDELTAFAATLPESGPALAIPDGPPKAHATAHPDQGTVSLITHLRMGSEAIDLGWAMSLGKPASKSTSGKTSASSSKPGSEAANSKESDHAGTASALPVVPDADASSHPMKWFAIQKALGPLHVGQLGLGYKAPEQQIEVLLDASIGAGGLSLAALGLGVDYGMADHDVSFHLDGIGIAYDGGPTQIAGTFLRLHEHPDELSFVGEAMLKAESFGLSALGAYADTGDYKSLFVYAFLDDPIGGPPFFFVEGLAAGFGYNRRVADISVDQIADFPLVAEAMKDEEPGPNPPASPADTASIVADELRKVASMITPAAGEHFLALGVKFSSFKVIDSFALLLLRFGRRITIDVLGLSTAVLPPRPPGAPADEPVTKLAVVQMAVKAHLDPAAGFLGIDAHLTDESWVLSPDCHLTGDFAFYSWFDGPHQGDFVTSLGGYHPDFPIPDHYPRPERLRLDWQVCDEVDISGDCYFAITPNALMAGGHLAAHWHAGDLWASFEVGADFLMQYKPFHYQASAGVEISAGYGSLSGSVGADLKLWGPDFSGTAEIHLGPFISFEVSFGDGPAAPPALGWPAFRAAFLPPVDDDTLSLGLTRGAIRSITDKAAPDADTTTPGADDRSTPTTRWVVNPKEFVLSSTSSVPYRTLAWHREEAESRPISQATPTPVPQAQAGAGAPPAAAMAEAPVAHAAAAPARSDGVPLPVLPDTTGLVADFGIAPMGLSAPLKDAVHSVQITDDGIDVNHLFELRPTTRPFPAALWGTQGTGSALRGEHTIPALGGTDIVPRAQVRPGRTSEVLRKHLDYCPHLIDEPADPATDRLRVSGTDGERDDDAEAAARTAIRTSAAAAHEPRSRLLSALGFDPAADVRLPHDPAADYDRPPRIVATTGAAAT